MKIKGRVVDVIPPNKHEEHLVQDNLPPKNVVIINREDVPQSFFKRLVWEFKHRKEKWIWFVLTDNEYTKGDIVELNANVYMQPTKFFEEMT